MTMLARVTGAVVLAACLLAGGVAAAQDSQQKAAANTLFDEGKRLFDAGQTEEACRKFAASLRVLAQLGTRLNLANCYDKLGRTASAWAEFREAASLASKLGDQRESFARGRVVALEPRLLYLTVKVDATEVPDLIVRRDGATVPAGLFGSRVPVDPGEHTIEAEAPLYKPWSTKVSVADGAPPAEVTVPMLEKDPEAERKARLIGAVDEGPRDPGKTRRFLGIGVGAAGIAMVGVGAVFGLRAKSKWDESKDHCNDQVECDQTGVDLVNSAQSAGTVSTVLFIGGGLAIAGGVVLFLTAPKSNPEEAVSLTPVVAPGFTGVSLRGGF
jgi:hypothetical protein